MSSSSIYLKRYLLVKFACNLEDNVANTENRIYSQDWLVCSRQLALLLQETLLRIARLNKICGYLLRLSNMLFSIDNEVGVIITGE